MRQSECKSVNKVPSLSSFLLKVVRQNTEYESKIELKPKFCFYSRVQKNATLLGSLINFVVTFGVNNTSIFMS